QSGASVLAVDHLNKSPLHLAIEFSANYKIIVSLLNACRSSTELGTLLRIASSRYLVTPLHDAILMGRIDVVKLLLNGKCITAELRNLMLRVRDSAGHSIVSIAATAGRKDIFEVLLPLSFAMEQIDDNQRNVVHTCAQIGQHEILSLILTDDHWNHLVNRIDSNGWTPLHLAARWGYVNIIKLLLVHHALPTLVDRNGETPLALAMRHASPEAIHLLQQYTCIAMLDSQPDALGQEPPESEKKNSYNNNLPGSELVKRPEMVPDQASTSCFSCQKAFTLFRRRHHCRACGLLFCTDCADNMIPLPQLNYTDPVRVCDQCIQIPASNYMTPPGSPVQSKSIHHTLNFVT
ncbi:MAG: ankyrin repeat domain-containing protein, partial [archaeon]|nr:ankyrin repeat domain-containing protein [archaeon]